MINVRTNNKWNDFKYRNEVPNRVLRDQFDWTDSDDVDGFFKYNGTWYHISEFTRSPSEIKKMGWDGIKNESFSSGVLITLSPDGEQYKVASYYTTSD